LILEELEDDSYTRKAGLYDIVFDCADHKKIDQAARDTAQPREKGSYG
jgi:hypothetical protein